MGSVRSVLSSPPPEGEGLPFVSVTRVGSDSPPMTHTRSATATQASPGELYMRPLFYDFNKIKKTVVNDKHELWRTYSAEKTERLKPCLIQH